MLCTNSNPQLFWKYVRQKCNPQDNKKKLNLCDEDGVPIPSSQLCDLFNNFIKSCHSNIQDEHTVICNSFDNNHNKACNIQDCPNRITLAEVYDAINKVKTVNSCGIDNLPIIVYKNCADIIGKALCDLFNLILSTGSFPEDWKTAKVIPVPKKGNSTKMDNYRPISILPAISKVFEKIIHQHLVKFLQLKEIISNSQFGFQKKLSTTNNLITFNYFIQKTLDAGNEVHAVFVDFRKAFDSVNHTLLIHKLYCIGFHHCYIELLQNYLSNRYQYTFCNGYSSKTLPCIAGVPQGSLLGPMLFIIFINNISLKLTCNHLLFADDLKIYSTISTSHFIEDIESLQHNINLCQMEF